MRIIGISGSIEVGKTTLAKNLSEYYPNVIIRSFATHLKESAKFLFGLNDWQVYTSEGKRSLVEKYNLTVRQLLQKLATDFCRDMIHKDFWILSEIEFIEKTMKESPNSTVIVIYDDLRFTNECDFIHSFKGRTMKLYRNFVCTVPSDAQNHKSEGSIPGWKIDFILHAPNDIEETTRIATDALRRTNEYE